MKHWTVGLVVLAVGLVAGCESTDLGRYCVVGQEVPDVIFSPDDPQPSVNILNIEAPECTDRVCLQQGPYARRPGSVVGQCNPESCPPPYSCVPADPTDPNSTATVCAYKVKAFCTHLCKKHDDCKGGNQDANGDVCSQFVCHKQGIGEPLEGHCVCVCKDFLIKEDEASPRFYYPDEQVPPPEGCL